MFGEAQLSARDKALYGKLHISEQDIYVSRGCAVFLRKKGWHTPSLFRRGSIPIQQRSFTTTMIVAYSRPFMSGKGYPDFPTRLIKQYDVTENGLHRKFLSLRNEAFAHSDSKHHRVTPLKGDLVKSIDRLFDVSFSPEQIDTFLNMTKSLLTRISARMEEIRVSGS
jgi:hypothetical protein